MKTITYKSFPAALDALCEKIRSERFARDKYTLVLTPDRYTQSVERALFGGGGSLCCEVLTLSRLCSRICPGKQTLSREGGVMMTARAISACSGELGYYAKAAQYPDFAREVYNVLKQIDASAPTDENGYTERIARAAVGSVKPKLDDLAVIKREYERIKAQSTWFDAQDKLVLLERGVFSSDLVKNADVYAIGYADTTRLNMRVLGAISSAAKSFCMFTAAPPEKRKGKVEMFGCADAVTEYKEIARRIRGIVHERYIAGERAIDGYFSDIAVICTKPRALERILREYGIPAYTDSSVALALTPTFAAVNNIYKFSECLKDRRAIDCKLLVSLAKNPYIGADRIGAESLQYRVSVRGGDFVTQNTLFADLSDHPDARAAAECVMAAAECFDRGGKNRTDFAGAVRALSARESFLTAAEKTRAEATDELTPVTALIDLLGTYTSGDFDTDAAMLFSAARAVEIKSVPRMRDSVTVTVPQTLRLSAVKYLIVADFNEGILPVVTTDSGLLDDGELASLGGAVEPTVAEANRRMRDELRAVVYNAENVFFAYSKANGGKRATFASELAETLFSTDGAEQAATLLKTDDPQTIAFSACTLGAAREIAARGQTKHRLSLSSAERRSEKDNGGAHAEKNYAPFCPTLGEGAVNKPTISVSELTNWFKCPYRRFLTHSVRLCDRPEKRGAPDFGIAVHKFMELFMQGDRDTSREAVQKVLALALEQEDIKLDPASFERMTDDAADYAKTNVEMLNAGSYAPTEYETERGGLEFGTVGKKAAFKCKIDRLDVCGKRARIIDYKTGGNKFDISACLNGCDMQLPLYAAAVQNDYDVTGMFYVKLNKRYSSDGKLVRPVLGCMQKDAGIAMEYDGSLVPGGEASAYFPVKLNKPDKNGVVSVSGTVGKNAQLDSFEFQSLIDRCKANADVAVDEIRMGYINRSPVAGVCEKCSYRGLCGEPDIRGTEPDEDEDGE